MSHFCQGIVTFIATNEDIMSLKILTLNNLTSMLCQFSLNAHLKLFLLESPIFEGAIFDVDTHT